MSTEYGMVNTAGSIKQQLSQLNRGYDNRKTWEKLYTDVDIARQQQVSSLKQDYVNAVADAYASAYNTNKAIANSNIGQGYKEQAISDVDAALEQAYDTYRNNYLQGISDVESTAAEAETQIDAALTTQAEYTKQFNGKIYEYLQYVFDKYGEGAQEDNIFYNSELWKRYTYEEFDENGKATGNRLLKSWEDIMSAGSYDEYTDELGNVQKEWTGLYDDSGNLTIKGADFYDQMLNYFDSVKPGEGVGFGQWLAENDSELYDWSTSYNPYDYTAAGTNAGSFKTLVGLTSTDQQYSFIERFGGMTKKEVDSMYSDFTSKVEELGKKVDKTDGYKAKSILKSYEAITDNIKTLTDDLGITEAIEEELGMTLSDFADYMGELTDASLSKGDIWVEGLRGAFGAGAPAGAAAYMGAKAGTMLAVGSATAAVPVVGWIATAIIAVGSAIYGGVSAANEAKAYNKQLAKNARSAYDNLVTNLVAFSHQQQRKAQGDFYKYNR